MGIHAYSIPFVFVMFLFSCCIPFACRFLKVDGQKHTGYDDNANLILV